MVDIADAVETARQRALPGTEPGPGDRDAADFRGRLDAHLPERARLFHDLYGTRADWADQLTALVQQAAQSWAERPAELKSLDVVRGQNSGWFDALDILTGAAVNLEHGIALEPQEFVWLRVTPRS